MTLCAKSDQKRIRLGYTRTKHLPGGIIRLSIYKTRHLIPFQVVEAGDEELNGTQEMDSAISEAFLNVSLRTSQGLAKLKICLLKSSFYHQLSFVVNLNECLATLNDQCFVDSVVEISPSRLRSLDVRLLAVIKTLKWRTKSLSSTELMNDCTLIGK